MQHKSQKSTQIHVKNTKTSKKVKNTKLQKNVKMPEMAKNVPKKRQKLSKILIALTLTFLMAGLYSEIRPSLTSHGHGGARAQPSSGDSTVPGFESNPIQSGDSTDPGFESNPILISNMERGQFSMSRDPSVATVTRQRLSPRADVAMAG